MRRRANITREQERSRLFGVRKRASAFSPAWETRSASWETRSVWGQPGKRSWYPMTWQYGDRWVKAEARFRTPKGPALVRKTVPFAAMLQVSHHSLLRP